MGDTTHKDVIHTRIWLEEPEPDNPFVARAAYCHGYDVYNEVLRSASWVEMLYLLFRGELPSSTQSKLLETLAIALANPGPRDPSVHAAMCGGIGGSTAAASLIAALAVGAGHINGAREIWRMMRAWVACGNDLTAWGKWIKTETDSTSDVWPAAEHPPGFEPYGVTTSTIVRQTLTCLSDLDPQSRLNWLAQNLNALEQIADRPLSLSGVAATALTELGFTPEQGEMLYLLLRLPGAAAHALEQRGHRYRDFPFFSLELENDPTIAVSESDPLP